MNNIEEIASSFAREYGNDAIYPSKGTPRTSFILVQACACCC